MEPLRIGGGALKVKVLCQLAISWCRQEVGRAYKVIVAGETVSVPAARPWASGSRGGEADAVESARRTRKVASASIVNCRRFRVRVMFLSVVKDERLRGEESESERLKCGGIAKATL